MGIRPLGLCMLALLTVIAFVVGTIVNAAASALFALIPWLCGASYATSFVVVFLIVEIWGIVRAGKRFPMRYRQFKAKYPDDTTTSFA